MIDGQRVQERMEAAGLSQAELARRVGVSQPTINNLINRSKKGSAHLHKVARELGTTPAYLTRETDDPNSDFPNATPMGSDARELIERFAVLDQNDRRALLQIVRTMSLANIYLVQEGIEAGNDQSPTLHDKRQEYRGREDR